MSSYFYHLEVSKYAVKENQKQKIEQVSIDTLHSEGVIFVVNIEDMLS